ncbi:MAG: sodium:proton antiporter [Caulobacter sp.]|nr:sodium:proton antiporter [Caulobacter sp.]
MLPHHLNQETAVSASQILRPARAPRRLAGWALPLALLCAQPASAHDFWLQPNAFWIEPWAPVSMMLQVGHGHDRQRSPIALSRISRFATIAPDGVVTDRREALRLGAPAADGDFRLGSPGAHMLVLETDAKAASVLPAPRFNAYLEAEGLTPALEHRARTHRTGADGSERYSRVAKAIVQVGPPGAGSQAQVTRPLGLPLEIVPERSPYALPRPASLPVRVLYEGRPLPGALVRLTNLDNDAAPLETHRTDHAGRAVFALPETGTWLVNLVWTKPSPASRDTDFETVFSSLSFGFPAPSR